MGKIIELKYFVHRIIPSTAASHANLQNINPNTGMLRVKYPIFIWS